MEERGRRRSVVKEAREKEGKRLLQEEDKRGGREGLK